MAGGVRFALSDQTVERGAGRPGLARLAAAAGRAPPVGRRAGRSPQRGIIERYPFDPARARITGPAETLWVGRALTFIDVSPVSGEIVLSTEDPEDLVLLRADGKLLRKLTDDPARDRYPRWAPDGSSIAFNSYRDGGVWGIWTVRPDGSGLRRLSPAGRTMLDPVWAPDGRRLWVHDTESGFFLRPGDSRIERLPSTGPSW